MEKERITDLYQSPLIEITLIHADIVTLSDDPYVEDQYGDIFG